MRIALICKDKPGHLETRLATRAAHLAYVKETGVVEQAGPFVDAQGNMYGSLIILDVTDMQAARDWAENDPYAQAGLFEGVSLSVWNRVIG